ncbi:MAG: molybdopterin-dependent oxidoreductase [Acidimicrobiaceae bacterium]|nr:molybdopterin-dependent oxidoreductase [Acidimicrobiaceae bacterium]MXW62945.1 molybdopterin-dependent oxidoreductase [Acidimicrobiaceae bacterium]MYC41647.1 molybdopterin-dependent oxidoreductase [Acidimicrobiaceae bacterium]
MSHSSFANRTNAKDTSEWHQTACMLCSINCGVEIKIDDRRITRVRGDKAHPGSRGYTCEKALRLDHYQNGKDRLSAPLRRRTDGTYEEIDWDTAIREVAAGLAKVRDEHGGEKIFYYGGGAQGNHLPGGFSGATRKALGMRYQSNALAQEKTGEFWVDGQLYGAMSCHTSPDFHHTDCAVFVGKNPWHSHGFPRARVTLKEISNDPGRHLIVIDPRRTETADLADIHLQVRPGADAWLLGAMLKILVGEGLADRKWLARHANRFDDLTEMLSIVDIEQWCEKAGVPSAEVRHATTTIANAKSCAIFEDLGIQMAPHSTLNSWLEKLIYILTGNFGNKGGMNLHTRMGKLAGGGSRGQSPVGGHRILGGLIACNHIPGEILTDHPDRFRAMIVESSNPIHSLADSQRMREAFGALDFVVVIDVAMTETAREADYVLPACSQYEKWEATFFTTEFPDNYFHLRQPIFEPLEGTLTEAEIHRRLCRELGAYDDEDLEPLKAAAAQGREAYGEAFFATLADNPELGKYTPVVLYETLGPALGEGNEVAAVMWGLSQIFVSQDPEAARRAGIEGEGLALGDALFEKIFTSASGMVFSTDPYEQTWERMRTPDHKINLMIEELQEEFASLATTDPRDQTDDYPFVLSAGERRSYTANTAIRDPQWRRKKPGTGLRINPEDAESLGLDDGGKVRLTTKRGETVTEIEISSTLQPGHVSLPNGQGLTYPSVADDTDLGISPNELTSEEDRDWFAGTPWHKHVRARLEKV